MKCLIDFGNSRCKWAYQHKQESLSVSSYGYKSRDQQQRVKEVLKVMSFERCNEIHIVSVLGEEFERRFKTAISEMTPIEPKFYVVERNNHGIQLSYSDPSSYGVDRYAAIIAAHHLSQSSAIVVDCGTAMTIDAVNDSGHHMGGLIIPGAGLMRSLLSNNAAMIPKPEQSSPIELMNHSTEDALNSGSALILRYGLPVIIQKMKLQIDEDVEVYVTGGEFELVGLIDREYIHRPNLVLEGLEIMLG